MTARKAHGAIVVTSGIFTQEARAFAEGKPIDLVEGEQLASLIRSVQAKPSPSPVAPPTNPSSVAAHGQPPPAGSPAPASTAQMRCPKCEQPMVLRTAQHGPHPGQQFWGCSQFPRCQATKRLDK